MKSPYVNNIDRETHKNDDFRKVVFTGEKLQLVLMNIQPGEDIGGEVHSNVDQFFRIESGSGKAIINDKEYEIKTDFGIVVPAKSKHNIINTGNEPMKLYSIYAPPQHEPGKIEHKISEMIIPTFENYINENK